MRMEQSFMPARRIHVVTNPRDPKMDPWYLLSETEGFRTPDWPHQFTTRDIRRFR